MTRKALALAIPLALLLASTAKAADSSPRAVDLTVQGASIVHTTDNGDSQAELAGNVAPDTYFEVFVEGNRVYSSKVAVNTWEPQWNEACSFSARRESAVTLAVYEADPDGGVRLLGRWEGTLSSLDKAAGTLRFGPIRKLSYRLQDRRKGRS